MKSQTNDFYKRIKVDINNPIQQKPFSKRDQYTCLKIMSDTYNIYDSLDRSSKAHAYYYSIHTELALLELDFRKENINGNEFVNKFDEICKKYEIDFDNLFNVTQEIDELKEQNNDDKKKQLHNNLEEVAEKYFTSRENARNNHN